MVKKQVLGPKVLGAKQLPGWPAKRDVCLTLVTPRMGIITNLVVGGLSCVEKVFEKWVVYPKYLVNAASMINRTQYAWTYASNFYTPAIVLIIILRFDLSAYWQGEGTLHTAHAEKSVEQSSLSILGTLVSRGLRKIYEWWSPWYKITKFCTQTAHILSVHFKWSLDRFIPNTC